jgi:hypothetical protein
MIVISAQYGESKASTVLRPMHRALNLLLEKNMVNLYFNKFAR